LPGAASTTPELVAVSKLPNAITTARKLAVAQINENKNLRFITFFSIQLTWTHYSTASRRDAMIDTSRIKLANRDSAVLTPDESGWFRALLFSPLLERVAFRKLAAEALKIFESAQSTSLTSSGERRRERSSR
jgi:hypothetical protein